MSFIHKSVWVQFLITLFICYSYTTDMAQLISTEQLTNDSFTKVLISTAIQLIVLNIVVSSIVAIFNNKDEVEQQSDERDVWISLKGSKVAYGLLSTWVVIILVQLSMMSIPGAYYYFDALSAEFNILNMLLAGFLLAEAFRFSTQLYHYHKGL